MASGPGRGSIVVRLLVLLVMAGAASAAWFVLRPRPPSEELFTGYVTSANIYMAAPVSGSLLRLDVRRGDRVAAGAPLFRIDPTTLSARADQAGAQLQANIADLAAQNAAIDRAQAGVQQAQIEIDRAAVDLRRYLDAEAGGRGAVAQQQIDQARAVAETARRAGDVARAQLVGAQAQAKAAASQTTGAEAGVVVARRQVAELSPVAPSAGYVEDVLYQAGEWVPANAAVVSIVPDNQVKVRFYVPEGRVNAYRRGATVAVSCDGCAAGLTARIDYVAPRPEFTPPVIYSLTTRDKLVFMVEAVPANPAALVVGQPISVTASDHPATKR
ncbi:MAG: yhiI1 [Caulobacteraceae bacterium]|nr:yhiI1 [Caulobacteraceae bacterium]